MDPTYARAYRALYERHWWWRARERLILDRLEALRPEGGWRHVLDVGCGDGLFFDRLERYGAPEGVEPDGTLVVETTGFNALRWGNGQGIDSSEKKKIVERYKLIDGGKAMSLSYTLEDHADTLAAAESWRLTGAGLASVVRRAGLPPAPPWPSLANSSRDPSGEGIWARSCPAVLTAPGTASASPTAPPCTGAR